MCKYCGGSCFLLWGLLSVLAARIFFNFRGFLRKNFKRSFAGNIALIFFTVLIASLFIFPPVSGAGDPLKVTVTILPLAEFVEKVGGEHVEVNVMVPRGADPHTYEPTPSQMRGLSDSDLYVKLGSGIEFELVWMDKLIALNPGMVLCDASKGIGLMGMDQGCGHAHHSGGSHHTGKDPHIWLSPLNAIVMVANIRDALIDIDPGNKELYRENAGRYIVELNSLNSYIKQRFEGAKGHAFMVFHSAWGYYAADHGLRELTAGHYSKDPTPRQLAALVREARRNGIKVVFASPQFSKRTVETIAREINGKVDVIDPLAKDYIDNIKRVTDILAEGL